MRNFLPRDAVIGICGGHSLDPGTSPSSADRSVIRKGQVTLRKELLAQLGIQPGQRIDGVVLPGGRLELHAEHATGTIGGFIGLLADPRSQRASLDGLNGAAASGWAGVPAAGPKP